MRSSDALREFIKGKESLRLKAYPDPKTGGAPWTAGWGTTGHGIGPDTVLTLEQAEALFDEDISRFDAMANDAILVRVTQGQFDAFVSILYNVGPGGRNRDGIIHLKDGRPSTLLRKLNDRDYLGARAEFIKWVSPGSNVENGLRARRQQEVEEFWDAPA